MEWANTPHAVNNWFKLNWRKTQCYILTVTLHVEKSKGEINITTSCCCWGCSSIHYMWNMREKKYKKVTSAYLSVRPWLGGCYYFVMYIYGAFVWKNNRFLDWFLFLFCGCMCAGCLKLLSTLAVSVLIELGFVCAFNFKFSIFLPIHIKFAHTQKSAKKRK